jgi:hypothetical protein
MKFIQDTELERDVGALFGQYLGTFVSARGQVRADLFQAGSEVIAHVSFPTGLGPSNVEDRYLSELRAYAAKKGIADRFRIEYS